MSSFDSISDFAFALRTEAQEIDLKFKQGVPVTGQGTIEWTIPAPARGCQSEDLGAYAGIVFLLKTSPLDETNIPQNGKKYTADPTADFDLHTGDKIGDAIVVGAVYECEKKARGEELTTTLVINDLKPDVSYYLAGYAVDCQFRYHSEGIRAYSDEYREKENNVPAIQSIKLGPNGNGVLPTDGTGLVPGVNYEFDLIVDDSFPDGANAKTIEFNIDGIDAGTYQDLVNLINNQILLIDNPPQSPTPPNANSFFWDAVNQKLYQFDGYKYNEVDALIEPTDPANVAMGSYWYNKDTNELKRWNVPNPVGWNDIYFVESEIDIVNPECDTYWFSGTNFYQWNGTTWCQKTLYASDTDPTDCPTLPCGSYWYDTNTLNLYVWNTEFSKWDLSPAIYWHEQPDSLSDNTHWFDETNNKLFVRQAGSWVEILDVVVQDTEPTSPTNGLYWFNPTTEELVLYQGSPAVPRNIDVLVWPSDPADIKTCSLWWNSITDELFSYDILNNVWEKIDNFVQSDKDPSDSITIEIGSIWLDTSTNKAYKWDGGDWVEITYINKPTDPTQINDGEGWFKKSTNTWNVWNKPNPGWNEINPIDSTFDPTSVPNGTYWFDTTNNALYVRNGITWTSVMFSTVPYVPKKDEQWYDNINNKLYVWNGEEWVEGTPVAYAEFDSNGGITFKTTGKGSQYAILVPTPENSAASESPCNIGTGYAYHGVNDISYAECEYANNNLTKVYTSRVIPENSFLWSNLKPPANVLRPRGGNDDVSGLPSYMEIGVGTDGTPDKRRELMDSIRSQLGYPVVEVELTNYQLDTCIQNALETFRQRAGSSVRRGFFFLDIEPGKQKYLLTNKAIGYNRITNIMAVYRFTSAFLSSAHGAGVYGQVVLQHLYNMGTYDLTSFFLVSQYVEQLEHLFATRLTFSWHEHERLLSFYASFVRPERVLMDCMVERTEQDLLTDRYTKQWIERYALSEAMIMLSHIRGKYSTLPGAGGGISLNAGELVSLAQSYRDELMQQLDDYVADSPEDVGMHSTFILG